MKNKLCYNDLISQLQKNPDLTIAETLKNLRTWIDYVKEEFGNLPLGLLQAYAYLLKYMEETQKSCKEQIEKELRS